MKSRNGSGLIRLPLIMNSLEVKMLENVLHMDGLFQVMIGAPDSKFEQGGALLSFLRFALK